jgi:hypothetical protein
MGPRVPAGFISLIIRQFYIKFSKGGWNKIRLVQLSSSIIMTDLDEVRIKIC